MSTSWGERDLVGTGEQSPLGSRWPGVKGGSCGTWLLGACVAVPLSHVSLSEKEALACSRRDPFLRF